MTLEKLKVIISAETKGLRECVKNAKQQLGGMNKMLDMTRNKLKSSFTGKGMDNLNQKYARQIESIKKQQIEIDKLRQKYERLTSGETEPKKVAAMKKELEKVSKELDKAVEKNISLGQAMDALKADADLEKQAGGDYTPETKGKMSSLQNELSQSENLIEKLRAKAEQLKKSLSEAKLNPSQSEEAQELAKKLDLATDKMQRLKNEAESTKGKMTEAGVSGEKSFSGLKQSAQKASSGIFQKMSATMKRLKNIILGALVFNAVSQGFTKLREYMSYVIKTNSQLTFSLAKVKGNLLTAFQHIFSAVTPALQSMINWLAKATAQIAAFISAIFGQTYKQSQVAAERLNNQVDNLKEESKKAANAVMGFDELNIISKQKDSDVSGIKPDFSMDVDTSKTEKAGQDLRKWLGLTKDIHSVSDLLNTRLGAILEVVGAIGVAMLGWKIASKIFNDIETLNQAMSALKAGNIVLGITLSIVGIALETAGIIDTIKNGLNEINFAEILAGATGIVIGGAQIGAALGSSVIGGSIGAVVAGVPMMITGLYDSLSNGITALNATLTTLGSTLAGAGIGAIIGSLGGPIGAGVGALIGLVVGVVANGIVMIVQHWDTLKDNICAVTDNISQKVGNIIPPELTEKVSTTVTSIVSSFASIAQVRFDTISNSITNIITTLGGICGAASTSGMALNSMVQLASSSFNGLTNIIGSVFSGAVSIIANIFTEIGTQVGNFVMTVVDNLGRITAKFIEIKSTVEQMFSDLMSTIVNKIASTPIGKNFQNKIQEVSDFIGDFSDKISSKINELAANINSFIDSAIGGISNTINNVFNSILSGIESVINAVINAVNKIGNLAGGITGKNYTVKNIELSRFAAGGFPRMGELFVAREAGPEMVGSINGRTAVANNSQIVSAVSTGVAKAVSSVMGNGESKDISGTFRIKGDDLVYIVDNARKRKGTTISKNFSFGGR